MTCHNIGNAIICVSEATTVDLRPYGARVWMDFHRYLGPIFYRSENCITEIANPSKKTWAAFTRWQESQK